LTSYVQKPISYLTWDEGLASDGVFVMDATWAQVADCKVRQYSVNVILPHPLNFGCCSIWTLLYVQVGRCLALSGVEQYLVLPAMDLSVLPAFSISVWFKDEGSGAGAKICSFSNGPTHDRLVMSKQGSTTDLSLVIGNGIGAGLVLDSFILTGGFPLNTWVHYVWTAEKNGTKSTWKLYQNGVLVSTALNKQYPITFSSLNYIGKSVLTSDAEFKGKVDSFMIVPFALQPGQISLLFQATSSIVSFFFH
jgi:hypothetical protein